MGLSTDIPPTLPQSFYRRSALIVARECIGKFLVSRVGGTTTVGRIVETEAYRGPDDAAAHSYRGRRTPRTEVMFGPAGYAYVFVLYGMHHAFNVVTARRGKPEAVLIRAIQPIEGVPVMARRRRLPVGHRSLADGPGKLCQALGITKEHYGADLTQGIITITDGPRAPVVASSRVGIDYAGEWANKPWRFAERGSVFVSKVRSTSV